MAKRKSNYSLLGAREVLIFSAEVVRTFRRICKVASRLALVTLTAQFTLAEVLINEIHYDPDVKTDPAEFIELYNAGGQAVDLNGWYFSDGIDYRFTNSVSLPAGGFLVVAQDPATIQRKYGAIALGPGVGTLANEGEKITLRNAAGQVEDEVNYQFGFPWPTVGDPPGYSIELVNPAFDNNLGGNWRTSVAGNPAQQGAVLIPAQSTWKYFKGLSEASIPTNAWRDLAFDDSAWLSGPAPFGYDPGVAFGTRFDDMSGNYTSFYLRGTFVVDDLAAITSLTLEALYDDGFKLWINGTNLLNPSLSTNEVPHGDIAYGPARESNNYDTFNLNNPASFLRRDTNIIAVQVHNILLSGSSDCFFDAKLSAQTGPSDRGPTPGRLNSVYATNLPPVIRQVEHHPKQPASGVPVLITAKVTDPDGVASVTLQYQVVDPGNYIELTDAAYTNNWTALTMNDAGQNGDEFAGDSVHTALIPASVQTHRRLVRYRITTSDLGGRSLTVPYPDDPQPNFAYFVYDGVPAWQAAVRPGVTPALNFDTNVMGRLPAIHLLAKNTSVTNATGWNAATRYGGDLYLWAGTLVFDGEVYDHIHYRARGGVWRYAMVKNMWKFDFNRGHDLQVRDDYGRKYQARWTKLNLGASIQQGDYDHRGEQGLFESVGFRLFNLADVPASRTTFVQFRVVDQALEADPGTQYEGDFWGVYLVTEQEDGRFLDEHGLPDSNYYKMEGGTGELNNLGPQGPTDKSDLNYILSNYGGATDDWWQNNWNAPEYFSYQAIVQGIHHYDISDGKNYFYYHHPVTGLWQIMPWDLDLTWAHNMYRSDSGGAGVDAIGQQMLSPNRVAGTGLQSGTGVMSLSGARPAFESEFRNRLREVRDLLFNSDQAYQLIDEHAWLLRGPTNGPTILDADRCMWDYNPKMANSAYSSSSGKAGQGRFYRWPREISYPGVTTNFDGCLKLMKRYVDIRGSYLDSLAADAGIPASPTVTYTGPAQYPLNRLTFRSSAYAGSNPFAAMKWRMAEVTDTNAPAYDPLEPKLYEATADWESAELTVFDSDLQVPPGLAKVGHSYRVRVRMKDTTGRWSHWSPAVQFVATEPDNAAALVDHLRMTEMMYNPPGDSDEFEFLELLNTSTNLTLTLDSAKFTAGVSFTFPLQTTLPPGGYLVLAKTTNVAAFRAHYGLAPTVAVLGGYSQGLADDGEQITLKTGAAGTEIVSFDYSDGRGWPVAADGAGHSLVPLDRALPGQATGALDYPGNWRASSFIGGSPGGADPLPPAVDVVLNEIAAHTDFLTALDSNDWIEFYNRSATDSPFGPDWYLSDDPVDLKKWTIPSSTAIPAHGWITFDEVSGFHYPTNIGFGLDKAGEQVVLSYLPGTAADRVVDAVRFKGQENDYSWERYPDGGEFWYPAPRSSNTVNLVPAQSLIINEVMYHPPSLDGTNDNVLDEYIEILNPTASTVSLFNTNGTWRLDGGAGFSFPANTTIPAGGLLVLVNFDPAVGTNLAWFRSLYGLTNPTVPILGPYSGKLGNRSDRLALERRQYPDLPGDPDSWVIVDEVIYGNQNPWPVAANAVGSALQRLAPGESGNDPTNWIAAAPGPGAASVVNPDRDGDGMPNTWEDQYGLNPDDLADAALDSDGDSLTNLQEYLAGTDPRDPASRLQFDSVSAASTTVTLQFRAAADRSYTVQYRDEVHDGPWTKLRDVAEPSARVIIIDDALPPGVPQRYYRLVAPAQP